MSFKDKDKTSVTRKTQAPQDQDKHNQEINKSLKTKL